MCIRDRETIVSLYLTDPPAAVKLKEQYNDCLLYTSACPLRQKAVSADVVGMGMGVNHHLKLPSAGLQYFQNLFPRILVVAAVYQTDLAVIQSVKPHFRRAINIICLFSCLNQFVHCLLYTSIHDNSP